MKKTLFISCTKYGAKEFYESPLYQSLFSPGTKVVEDNTTTEQHHLYTTEHHDLILKTKNTYNIARHYNKGIQFAIENKDDYDNVVFIHDDVSVEDRFLHRKLRLGLESADIIGLAGARDIKIRSPFLWHIISDPKTWSGAVAHPEGGGVISMTSFGPVPSRVLVLDGLLLAVKPETFENNPKLRFDEKIPTIAHFYDLDFCLTANENKLTLSTFPIWVVHGSPGLEQYTADFHKGEKYMLKKWKLVN
jgi:hypothetical protein